MADSVSLVGIAPLTARWESMCDGMHSEDKILSVQAVSDAVFALQFVREASLTSKIGTKMAGLTNLFCSETIVLR